ncbi:GNAT family N-acetyltransferase [Terricaulis sp.]|jgi:predicted GNAT family N-acyltransferase|uniref:GNAT family N-acetyltransferase n=1 Tax=Terricaulis sp. TaxID=2768686 RepID=UPI003A1029B8
MHAAAPLSVSVVRSLDQWMQAMSIRAEVYIGEQAYAYGEEFDGVDLAGATHLVACLGPEPVGACRVRWFADFAKLERVSVKRASRSGRVTRALWRATADLAGRKGYKIVLGHIERTLLPFWQRTAGFEARASRPSYVFAGREFVEAVARLPHHPEAISLDSPAENVLASESDLSGAASHLRVAS